MDPANDLDEVQKMATFELSAADPGAINKENPLLSLLQSPARSSLRFEVIKYLSSADIRNLRRLTRALWNNFATSTIQVRFNETKKAKHEQRMNAILYESEMNLQNFVFENVNFAPDGGSDFIGNSPHFDAFLTKFSPSLRSLVLVECQINMGVFFRLIANVPFLEELRLIKCDPRKLFIAGFGILRDADMIQYMETARDNLSRLICFVFEDVPPKELNKVGGISTLLGSTCQLETLSLLVYGPRQLSGQQFASILNTNRFSLRKLELKCFKFEKELLEFVWTVYLVNLAELNLCECVIESGDVFGLFLTRQLQLEEIQFSRMTLAENSFEAAENLTKLRQAHFDRCTLEKDVLVAFTYMTQMESLYFEGGDECIEEIRAFIINMDPNNLVHTLTFRNTSKTAADALPALSVNFPNLVYLDISTLKIPNQQVLTNIWTLDGLHQLRMSGCEFGSEPPPVENQNQLPTICDLQYLEVLDLSHTAVNDDVIRKQLAHLDAAQLNLSFTQVTFDGLYTLISMTQNMAVLEVRGCGLSLPQINELCSRAEGIIIISDEDSPAASDVSYIS